MNNQACDFLSEFQILSRSNITNISLPTIHNNNKIWHIHQRLLHKKEKRPPLSSNKLPGYTYQRETQGWSTIPPPLQKPTQTCSRIRSYFKCYKSTSTLQIETSFSSYKIALNNHNVLGPCLIDLDINSGQCEKLSKRTSIIFELYVEPITKCVLTIRRKQSCEIHTLSAAMAIDKEDSVKAQMTYA